MATVFNVGILDRSPVFTEGLLQVLRRSGYRVLLDISQPQGVFWRADVLVVDARYAASDPLADFMAAHPMSRAPVLLTVERLSDRLAHNYRRAGAQGVIDRTAAERELLEAIRSVATDRSFWGTDSADASHMATASTSRNETPPLSPRERQVLRHIARGLTHSQIARKLDISQHTVDTYVKRIRAKLELGNKAELTRAALREPHLWRMDESSGRLT